MAGEGGVGGGPEERRRYLPIPAAELPAQLALSPLPPALQRPQVFTFDTERFPFRAVVAEILGVRECELERLQDTEPGRAALQAELAGANHRKRGRGPHFSRLWLGSVGSPARARFDRILDRFMREFVCQRQGGGRVAYQKQPTFRVVLPSALPAGYLHCDADYHHPPSELNWWLPLTQVSGNNTLHCESSPGLADFTPVELQYGQVLRFYGNLCRHFTRPNDTTSCRVSFDTRVVTEAQHPPAWTDRLGRPCLFRVGGYYTHWKGCEEEDEPQADKNHCFV